MSLNLPWPRSQLIAVCHRLDVSGLNSPRPITKGQVEAIVGYQLPGFVRVIPNPRHPQLSTVLTSHDSAHADCMIVTGPSGVGKSSYIRSATKDDSVHVGSTFQSGKAHQCSPISTFIFN